MCKYLFYSDYFAKFAYHNNKRTGNYIDCMLKLNFKFLLLMYSKSILVTFACIGCDFLWHVKRQDDCQSWCCKYRYNPSCPELEFSWNSKNMKDIAAQVSPWCRHLPSSTAINRKEAVEKFSMTMSPKEIGIIIISLQTGRWVTI